MSLGDDLTLDVAEAIDLDRDDRCIINASPPIAADGSMTPLAVTLPIRMTPSWV